MLRFSAHLICVFASLGRGHGHLAKFAMMNLSEQAHAVLNSDAPVQIQALATFALNLIAVDFRLSRTDALPMEEYLAHLPGGFRQYACCLLAHKAYLAKDYGKCLTIAELSLALSPELYPIAAVYTHVAAAIALINSKRIDEALGHDWGKWESNNDGTHTRVCANDATHTETDDCSGGKATCASGPICEVCDESYGTPDPFGHDYALTESIPGTCTDPGLEVYHCQNEGCPDPVHEVATAAFGQHLYNHWDILGDHQHHTDCALCGGNVDVACTLWGMYDGGTLLTVCPVCGDFGETLFEILFAREDAAVPVGTLLVRGMEEPFSGALFGFTVAGVYGGELANIHGKVTVTIPVACEGFTVVRAEIIEDKEVRTEIPFTLEDGQLTIETDVAGLFLLVPAQ